MNTQEQHVVLRGVTWNHTRGLLPCLATAQRFAELHPDVEIDWQKRSLQKFADAPLPQLAARFDLLVIDHPSIGEAAEDGLLLPLDEHLPAAFLADQDASSVGQSHRSYSYGGHQYALAIDAATPVAGWRPDLLPPADVPRTWDDLLALARRGRVAVPAIPIDALMHLFMLANALADANGTPAPFSQKGAVLDDASGREALASLRELVQLSVPGSLERNPIRTWELLSTSSTVAYCPFAYGYSNYSRAGYGAAPIQCGELVTFRGVPLRSTLGGAGLAISARCTHRQQALDYAQFVARPETQRALYALSGGQPGHRGAWVDATLNQLTSNFFACTLPTLDRAWVRPRWPGFIAFQDRASALVHRFLVAGGSEAEVLADLNEALAAAKGTHA